MRRSWKFIGLFAISYLLLAAPAYALPEVKPTFPRLANFFLHWAISDEEARELSKFDLIILDAEVQNRSRAQLQTIRRLNPNALLLAYITPSEIRRDALNLRETSPLRYKLGSSIPENWYLKNALGERRSFWPGTWIVNVTNDAPLVNGQRWNEYLADFVVQEIFSTGLWDGVFYDNGWDDIVHFARGVPDLNDDRLQDDPAQAKQSWQEGLRTLFQNTITRAPNKFVFQNDGVIYAPSVHGVLLENFPRKGWSRYFEDLKTIRENAITPAVPILNATTFNSGRRDDYRAMRFGFATSLITDSYYSFDFGDQDHGQTWYYDEYGIFLGEPLAVAQKGSLWRRNFEKGIVFLNPADTVQRLNLPIEIEKIRGSQDTLVNDGRITQEIQVGPQDGVVVLRPLQTIIGAPFENGIFARVFNAQGESTRAGFFALDRTSGSGMTLARLDLDGDQKDERVQIVQRGGVYRIEIEFGDGTRSNIVPFGAQWKGEIRVAFGNTSGDGTQEITVGQGKGGGQVRVYRPNGTPLVLPFFPFGERYRGGVEVAVGDLNGNGNSQIVVGAGPGGGPQVRIFSGQGRLLSGGFFAYDPRFRGGVRVSVGDVDQDGAAEIVTGPGIGGGPQVRIFDGKGRAKGPGFFAFDRSSRAGATPLVTDIDGDGRNEILAVTREVL